MVWIVMVASQAYSSTTVSPWWLRSCTPALQVRVSVV
jgi:hypothetical protein